MGQPSRVYIQCSFRVYEELRPSEGPVLHEITISKNLLFKQPSSLQTVCLCSLNYVQPFSRVFPPARLGAMKFIENISGLLYSELLKHPFTPKYKNKTMFQVTFEVHSINHVLKKKLSSKVDEETLFFFLPLCTATSAIPIVWIQEVFTNIQSDEFYLISEQQILNKVKWLIENSNILGRK